MKSLQDEIAEYSAKATDSLISDEVEPLDHDIKYRGQRNRHWPWVIHLIFLLINFSIFYMHTTIWALGQSCVEKYSSYSPALHLINEKYQTWQFNDSGSSFRGPPDVNVDKAWSRVTDIYPFSISSKETLEKIGAPVSSVKIPGENGGYEATLAVVHQMHCLKSLWQNTYREYYQSHNSIFSLSPSKLHEHFDHCADVLRHQLMCSADVSVITFDWVKGEPWPRPHYGNPQKCRNYEDVLQWARHHQASVPPGARITKPDDAIELESS